MRTLTLLGGVSLALLLAATACEEARRPPFEPSTVPSATPRPTATVAVAPTSASPPPTSSPTPEVHDLDGFKRFAANIVEAVATRSGQLFAERARESSTKCAGTEELGPCAGKPAGTELEGVWWGLWRTDAVELHPPDTIASDFESFVADAEAGESDGFGAGSAALYALAHNRPGVFGEGEAYYAILTGIFEGDAGMERRIAAYQFSFDGERWRLYSVIEAGPLYEEWLSGECPDCYDQWERWEGVP
jgi:hypothetical protein